MSTSELDDLEEISGGPLFGNPGPKQHAVPRKLRQKAKAAYHKSVHRKNSRPKWLRTLQSGRRKSSCP